MPDAPPEVRAMILRWTCALPYLMRSHLLHYKTGSDSLQELLTAEEVCLCMLDCCCVACLLAARQV